LVQIKLTARITQEDIPLITLFSVNHITEFKQWNSILSVMGLAWSLLSTFRWLMPQGFVGYDGGKPLCVCVVLQVAQHHILDMKQARRSHFILNARDMFS